MDTLARGDTCRLMCPVTGAFRGLVRIARHPGNVYDGSAGPLTVWAETPILDWLTTGDQGEYPYRMPYEIGHVFNAERHELELAPRRERSN